MPSTPLVWVQHLMSRRQPADSGCGCTQTPYLARPVNAPQLGEILLETPQGPDPGAVSQRGVHRAIRINRMIQTTLARHELRAEIAADTGTQAEGQTKQMLPLRPGAANSGFSICVLLSMCACAFVCRRLDCNIPMEQDADAMVARAWPIDRRVL